MQGSEKKSGKREKKKRSRSQNRVEKGKKKRGSYLDKTIEHRCKRTGGVGGPLTAWIGRKGRANHRVSGDWGRVKVDEVLL